MNIPKELKYTNEHEWIKVEGELAYIGITDHAQHALGDIVYLDMPETGAQLTKGQSLGAVESVKAVSEIYAPLSGTVSAINEELTANPEKVNSDPYGSWMVALTFEDPAELAQLLDADAYQRLCEEED